MTRPTRKLQMVATGNYLLTIPSVLVEAMGWTEKKDIEGNVMIAFEIEGDVIKIFPQAKDVEEDSEEDS